MVWLAGCASAPRVVVIEPVGPEPTGASPGLGDGSLVVYSARMPEYVDVNVMEWRENNDFGKNEFLGQAARTDYTIYTEADEVFQHVRNARDSSDGTPTPVMLPAGSYKVEAEGINCDGSRVAVTLQVLVKPGQTTIAHLDGNWNAPGEAPGTELAKLPCGRVIGWRASEPGFAVHQASSPASASN